MPQLLKRIILLFLLFFGTQSAMASQDQGHRLDSLSNRSDSLMTDSAVHLPRIGPKILLMRDSLEETRYADSIRQSFGYSFFNPEALYKGFRSSGQTGQLYEGRELLKGDLWILGVIGLLLVLFAFLKNAFEKQMLVIVQSFFSNRVLGNLNKEDNLFTSWPFLLLFIQFGFTLGMFLYLSAQHRELQMVREGFRFFASISLLIIVLYVLKIIALRLLGFVFDIQRPVNEYVSVLYLSYFNAALLFIPLVIAFALSPAQFGDFYVLMGIILVVIIFIFQMIRAGVLILSQYRFPKVYLFLYFCTLEFCPIIILIKAIGF